MVFGRTAGCALVTAASLLSCAAITAAQESLPRANPASQSESQPSAQQPSTITYKDGLLTVSVRAAALTAVLDQISTRARVAIIQVEDLSNQRISAAFENLPLEEGLRRLLKDNDSFLFLGVDDRPPASVRAVWVYPRGRGRGVAPVPPDKWASTAELSDRVTTLTNPEERAEAYRELIARGGAGVWNALTQALADPAEQVRSLALYSATSHGVEVAPSVLMQALNDMSKDVRFLALEALARGPEAEARAAAELGCNDPDPVLRQYAQQILDQLSATSRQTAAPSQVPKRP